MSNFFYLSQLKLNDEENFYFLYPKKKIKILVNYEISKKMHENIVFFSVKFHIKKNVRIATNEKSCLK